jgi:hypothetical protein
MLKAIIARVTGPTGRGGVFSRASISCGPRERRALTLKEEGDRGRGGGGGVPAELPRCECERERREPGRARNKSRPWRKFIVAGVFVLRFNGASERAGWLSSGGPSTLDAESRLFFAPRVWRFPVDLAEASHQRIGAGTKDSNVHSHGTKQRSLFTYPKGNCNNAT